MQLDRSRSLNTDVNKEHEPCGVTLQPKIHRGARRLGHSLINHVTKLYMGWVVCDLLTLR